MMNIGKFGKGNSRRIHVHFSNRRLSTQSAMLERDYAPPKPSGKFFLQPSTPEPRTSSRKMNSPPGSVHTPHSLEFSTKRRIFDKGPEVFDEKMF